ncbi:MAG: hypothetical protein ABI600_11435 [Luteolibacter sp.]
MAQCPDSRIGSEHVVDFDDNLKLVGKTTKPPNFGLIPAIVNLALAVRPGEAAKHRKAIEFIAATPLEYLDRWQMNNEIFGDDVQLVSMIQWSDGQISFGITQPQYQGVPAEARDIDRFFMEAGWTLLKDPSHHKVFFNYAFQVMAIDAESRNCYITEDGLQPFDVILCEPDEETERFLRIYPD